MSGYELMVEGLLAVPLLVAATVALLIEDEDSFAMELWMLIGPPSAF